MAGPAAFGLGAFQWIALLTAVLTVALLTDAFVGHYRSGFAVWAQYVPFVAGALLVVGCGAVIITPAEPWTRALLHAAGWAALVSGLAGAAFHHYYGIIEKPGSYRWLLHHLMYHAPPLAPLGLCVAGGLAIMTSRGLGGGRAILGAGLPQGLVGIVSLGLVGASLQAAVLHYRGAFNNVLMYAPLTAPLLAAAAGSWFAATSARLPRVLLVPLLWITVVIGFVGLGMHLRGVDRQMGGLYLAQPNLMEGPPQAAPVLFAAFAAIGLIAVRLP